MNCRTWAEIDLDALAFNMKQIKQRTQSNAKVMAIVKADAYGHGVIRVAETLAENGADTFGVACTDEALQLRKAGFKQDILIIGPAFPCDVPGIIDNNITATVQDVDFAKSLSDYAKLTGKNAKVHIKLDTGMRRIGFVAEDSSSTDRIIEISKLPNIFVEGIFSHLSCADTENDTFSEIQFGRFCRVCEKLESMGLKIPVKHIANSAAIIKYPHMHLDMVRAGIICYGCYPSRYVREPELKPVMSFKTKVSRTEKLFPGDFVGYGATYVPDKPGNIVSLCVGYADGYPRCLSNKGRVLLKGKFANIIGNICMDQCMIDAENVNNVISGDEATLFGYDGKQYISVDEIADSAGTINYEILCMVGKRVPRIYVKNGIKVSELRYIK